MFLASSCFLLVVTVFLCADSLQTLVTNPRYKPFPQNLNINWGRSYQICVNVLTERLHRNSLQLGTKRTLNTAECFVVSCMFFDLK